MKRLRNMSKMKKQEKTLEKELHEMEARNLPGVKFKILVIRMLNDFRERVDELIKNFNKEIGNMKIERTTTKNICT